MWKKYSSAGLNRVERKLRLLLRNPGSASCCSPDFLCSSAFKTLQIDTVYAPVSCYHHWSWVLGSELLWESHWILLHTFWKSKTFRVWLFLFNNVLSSSSNYLLDSILFYFRFEYNGFVLAICHFKAL